MFGGGCDCIGDSDGDLLPFFEWQRFQGVEDTLFVHGLNRLLHASSLVDPAKSCGSDYQIAQDHRVSPSGQLEPPNGADFPRAGSHLSKLKPPKEAVLPFVELPRPLQESAGTGRDRQRRRATVTLYAHGPPGYC